VSGSDARREAERQLIKEEMPANWRYFCAFQKGEEWRVGTRLVYRGVEESGAPEEFLRVFLSELEGREDPGDHSVIFPRFAEAFAIAMGAKRAISELDEEGSTGRATALTVAAEADGEGRHREAAGGDTSARGRVADDSGATGAAEEGKAAGVPVAAGSAPADSDGTVQGDGALGRERVPPDKLESTAAATVGAIRGLVTAGGVPMAPDDGATGNTATPGSDGALEPGPLRQSMAAEATVAAPAETAGAREVPSPLRETVIAGDVAEETLALLEATTAMAPTRKEAEVRFSPFPGRGRSTFIPGPFSKREAKAAKFWQEYERKEREARAIASMKIAQAAPRRPRGAGGGLPKSRAGRRQITAAGIGPAADSHQPAKGTKNGTRAVARAAPGEGTVPTGEREVAPLEGVRVRARVPPDKAGSGAMRKTSRRKAKPRSVAWTTRRFRAPRGSKRVVQKTAQWKRKRMRRRWRRVQSRPRVKAAPIRGRVRVPPDKTGSLTVESMWNGLPEQQAWLMRLGARMGVG
jgi:hypothetical protein